MTVIEQEFQANFNRLQSGQMSESDWFDYCSQILGRILDANSDVLTRLKFR